MFQLFNNKITIYLPTDILKYIHHEISFMILNEVKQFQLIMNSLNMVMKLFFEELICGREFENFRKMSIHSRSFSSDTFQENPSEMK